MSLVVLFTFYFHIQCIFDVCCEQFSTNCYWIRYTFLLNILYILEEAYFEKKNMTSHLNANFAQKNLTLPCTHAQSEVHHKIFTHTCICAISKSIIYSSNGRDSNLLLGGSMTSRKEVRLTLWGKCRGEHQESDDLSTLSNFWVLSPTSKHVESGYIDCMRSHRPSNTLLNENIQLSQFVPTASCSKMLCMIAK